MQDSKRVERLLVVVAVLLFVGVGFEATKGLDNDCPGPTETVGPNINSIKSNEN